MNLTGKKCFVDLRVPVHGKGFKDFAASMLIMFSRHRNDNDDWALLHPLWPPGNQFERHTIILDMRSRLKRSSDLLAELRRIRMVETTITELALQNILQFDKDLVAYFDANFL